MFKTQHISDIQAIYNQRPMTSDARLLHLLTHLCAFTAGYLGAPVNVTTWCESIDAAVGWSGWSRIWRTDSSVPSKDRRTKAWPHNLDWNLPQEKSKNDKILIFTISFKMILSICTWFRVLSSLPPANFAQQTDDTSNNALRDKTDPNEMSGFWQLF